jgi:hypothetical protein
VSAHAHVAEFGSQLQASSHFTVATAVAFEPMQPWNFASQASAPGGALEPLAAGAGADEEALGAGFGAELALALGEALGAESPALRSELLEAGPESGAAQATMAEMPTNVTTKPVTYESFMGVCLFAPSPMT